MRDALADYYFRHAEMFVIPIEHLSAHGVSAEFRRLLGERLNTPSGWIDLFDAAFALYWRRGAELAARAPQYWFPPRLQHCCIVTAAARVRPYFQPFNQSAWLLYAGDFDPTVSNREFAAYQFLHAERMGLLRQVTQTVVRNLSYWLLRSDAEVEQFAAACRLSGRPDAAAFRALAEALPWVRRLYHEPLKPPVLLPADPFVSVPHTGLYLPRAVQPQLDALVRRWTAAAEAAMAAFHAAHARHGRDRAGEVCAWLRAARPLVLVTDAQGRVLWDPETPERISATRAALGGISASVADSIRADLQVVGDHSRRFLASLSRPKDLPAPHPNTTQGGLSYLHLTRKLIAYNLREPGMARLRVPAPPYERFMLGARTLHEWGHLAADAGWVPIAADRRPEYQRLLAELAELFETIYREAPPGVRAYTADEMARVTSKDASPGRALARISVNRMPDYQANLLARRYLGVEELETYIRNNVYNLAFASAPTALFQRLARQAYEYQYLRFSRIADARRYFLSSTWFAEEYLATRIVGEEHLDRLLRTVGMLCDCYTVDASKFQSPGYDD